MGYNRDEPFAVSAGLNDITNVWHFNFGGNSNDAAFYDNLRIVAVATVEREGDVDGNGCVDDSDLLIVLFNFVSGC